MIENADIDINDGHFLENGWFFLGEKYANDFSQACGKFQPVAGHAEEWAETAELISDQCQRRGIPSIFAVGPAKWSVYRDFASQIPDFRPGQISVHDQISSAATSRRFNFLDLRDTLREGRTIADTYSPRDSHWNGYGAYLAWQELSSSLKRHFPNHDFFDPGRIESIQSSGDWNEATSLTGVPGSNVFSYPVFSHPFKDYQMRRSSEGWSDQRADSLLYVSYLPVDTRCAASTSGLRALIVRDSVGDLLSPYLNSTFEETYHRTHHVNVEGRPPNLSALLRDYAPDVVLFMFTERYLIYPFMDVEMERACKTYEERQENLACWPAFSGKKKLEVDGWERPKQPVLVKLPTQRHSSSILKICIQTEGTGALLVSYTVGEHVRHKHFVYRSGPNVFFADVSGDVTGDHVWLLDQHNPSPTFLTAVSLSY